MRALGGVGAQGSQAVASLALQVLATRLLGLAGLGRFGALYAVIVLATALCSGFVGDSLTVLERSHQEVRAALQTWLLVLGASSALMCGAVAYAIGFLTLPGALAFAGATAAFVMEDTFRRLLMANLHFWRIVLVDLTALVSSVLVVAIDALVTEPSLSHFLVALMIGQVAASIVAVILVPAEDRYLVTMRSAALGAVASFGGWRALQNAVRPAVLASVRMVGFIAVSATAVGGFEAARIYMAPAMLVVAGMGSYLFASYAARRDASLVDLVRVADRGVVTLFAVVGSFGVVAVSAIEWLGPILTDGRYELSLVIVTGWAAYAAAAASAMPYAQLASVRGRQAAVLGFRIIDSAVSLLGAIVVVAMTRSLRWVPMVLAAGSLTEGLGIRQFLLRGDVNAMTASADRLVDPA